MPDQKPWKRSGSARDPSRGIILDLQEDCEWKMPSTVMLPSIDIAVTLEDNMQVQCLPVFGSDHCPRSQSSGISEEFHPGAEDRRR